MGDPRREGGEGRDADIRAGAGSRARGGENKDGQPNVAEDQPNKAACDRGDETPKRDRGEEKSVQALEYR